MAKKTVWAAVSIELDWGYDDVDDEILMGYTNEVLVEAGFIVDDMGMVEGAPAPAPEAKGMNVYERFACGEYLSAFPNDVTFDEVMEMLLDRNDDVLVWEAFEHEHPSNVYEFISNLRDALALTFIPREEAK